MVNANHPQLLPRLGILDSGIGGLTLLEALIRQGAAAQYFYISDADHVPYGNKSQEFMLERISQMIRHLQKQDVNAILIACNTATAKTIDEIRRRFKMPFIGIEPYLNYLRHHPLEKNEKLALVLTQATYHSERFQKLKAEVDPASKVDIFPLKKLALLIESLKKNSWNEIQSEVITELVPLQDKGYTHLILGCTHYPIIGRFLKKHLQVELVNPAQAVIERVKSTLQLQQGPVDLQQRFAYCEKNDGSWISQSLKDFVFLADDRPY